MFKKVTKIVLAGIFGVGTMIGASSLVSAAEQPYKSDANVKFIGENTDPTGPVDPENPDPTDPVDPDDKGDKEGTTGPLSIDYVSNFDFGTKETSGNIQTYSAIPVTLDDGSRKVAPYAQVTDNRGTHAGWELKVAQPEQLSNGTVELEGAEITIGKDSVVTGTVAEDDGVTAAEDIKLSQTPEIVFSAAEGAKGGTWVNSFGSAEDINVKLTIPAGTKIVQGETYTTELNWTLEDIPLD